MRTALASSLLAVIVLAGCNGSSSSPSSTATGGDKTSPATSPSPEATSNAKVKVTVSKKGSGAKAEPGDTLWVSYVGKLKSGKEFDSTEKGGGKPFPVTLGAGQVIKGWEEGLEGAQEGSKLTLDIPYQLAYGEAGSGENIPPKSDLLFDLDVHCIIKAADEAVIRSTPVKPGSGPAIAEGDKVTMDYAIKLVNGLEIDKTKDKPFSFTVGNKETLKGIDAAVVGLKAGGVQDLFIPPKLGLIYGNQVIPANSPLLVHVEIKKVEKGKGN